MRHASPVTSRIAPLSAVLLLGLTHVAWAVPVRVQVLGPDKKPLPGAQVRVRFTSPSNSAPQGEPLSAVSDARGQATFEIADEVPGARGGIVGHATVWSVGLSMVSALLEAGANDIALEAGGVARGLVVDEAGKPVPNALLRVIGLGRATDQAQVATPTSFSAQADAAVSQARTDAQGRWSVSLAPLGGVVSVELAEEKFVRAAATARAVQTNAPFNWARVENRAREVAQAPGVVPQREYSGVTMGFNRDGILVARAGASISGRVLDPKGAPVAGVSVIAKSSSASVFDADIAQTDAGGEFRIARLLGGSYTLNASQIDAKQKIDWVPGEAAKVKVAPGASATVPELKMMQGGAVEVQLVDEATGQGVAGANVFSYGDGDRVALSLAEQTTDARGRATLHLPPGKRSVMMYRPPGDYLSPALSTYDEGGTPVDVKLGQPASVLWKLKKGLPAAGRLVDEKGQPIPNVSVSLRPRGRGAWDDYKTTRSDQAGQWSVGGFRPGAFNPSAEGSEWRVVSPLEITLPLKGAQDIVLAPIARVPLSGRVLDGEGKPVAGVEVRLAIGIGQGGYPSETGRVAVTSEDGVWNVPDVPEIAYKIDIQAEREGYAVERAPKATRKDNAWAVSEAVLRQRDAQLGGQILSAQGQPAANAQVLVAATRQLASADAAGRWKVSDLPRGESEVIAVSGTQSSVVTTIAPNDAISLRLKSPPTLAARDVDGAQAVLEDAWETSRGSKYAARDALPSVLAVADADAALALAGGAGQKPSGAAVLQIVRVLARYGEAQQTQDWTQKHLGALEDPYEREQALLLVAESLVGKDDQAARKWMALARAGYANLKDDGPRFLVSQRLAILGARLKEADANALFEQALALAVSNESGNGYFSLGRLALAVAPVDEAWAEKVVQAAIVKPSKSKEPSSGVAVAIANAVSGMARTNLPGARRLLAKYSKSEDKSPATSAARDQVLGQRAHAGEDVDLLVKEAGGDRTAFRAISLIAQNAPRERQAELFKRALELTQAVESISPQPTVRIVARLLPLDRAEAKAVLDRVRVIVEAPREEDEYSRLRADDVAGWAWLYREIDLAQARLAIEREWALGMALLPGREDDSRRWPDMAQLVVALMPLDIERARALAERLPITDGGAAFGAQRAIARWMVASEEERASKPLAFWMSDPDEARAGLDW